MAEHTYKPKDVVSVRGEYVQSINVGTDRAPLLMHDVLIEADHEAMGCSRILQAIAPEDVVPHLSTEDQDALLRVVRHFARISDMQRRHGWVVWQCEECGFDGSEIGAGIEAEMRRARKALSSLPDHLRARLEEEG